MKRIGVLGASAPGALICVQHILAESNRRGLEQPEISILLLSSDSVFKPQKERNWHAVATVLGEGIQKLSRSGADFAIIPANTPHYAWDQLVPQSPIPLLSIVDATVEECKKMGLRKVGITGTTLTTADGLYKKPLEDAGLVQLIPDLSDHEQMNEIIFGELVPAGKASTASTQKLLAIAERLKEKGCDGIVLGCTELPLVLNAENVGLPTIDTTQVLAFKALGYALME